MAHALATKTTATQRTAARQNVAASARLTWKDASGLVRFASATTRDLSEGGAFVECPSAAPLPLFRLVHLQMETAGGYVPQALEGGRVLAAVWRVEGTERGAAKGYALRFLADPASKATSAVANHDMAVAC